MSKSKMWVGILVWVMAFLASAVVRGADIGPDAFGYGATEDTAYSFLDISATGAAVLGGADDETALVDIGFTFRFYGKSYTGVCVSSNGLLTFGGCTGTDFANQDLSSAATVGDYPAIAPLWFDLTFAAEGAGAVHYQTLGAEGARKFVVQWQNAYEINGTKGVTFQAILEEGSGRIVFQYRDVDAGAGSPGSFGGKATVGIRDTEGQASGRALQWSYKVPVVRNGEAILLMPDYNPDGEPPVISGMPGPECRLWPPDNKLVQVATVVASDAGTGLATFEVSGVSNEPEGKNPDIVITGSGDQYVIKLRAARDGRGKGRIYTITATASDRAGNTITATSNCTVPHDQRK